MRRVLQFCTTILALVILVSCFLKQPEQQIEETISPTNVNSLVGSVDNSPLSTPSPTHKPINTSTPTTQPAPTLTAMPIPTITGNVIPEFPLTVGNSWVYSATYRGRSVNFEALTATYVITDQVIATQVYSSMFGAVIQRTSSLVEGSPYEDFQISDYRWKLENPVSRQYSYVINGNRVYQQDELDFENLRARVNDSGPYKYPLIYEFPFINETGFNCWYPGTSEIGNCHDPNEAYFGGFYYVSEGPISITTPAGKIENCYIVGISGRKQKFCFNTGIAGSDWLYTRQVQETDPPMGYDIKLITYTLVSSGN